MAGLLDTILGDTPERRQMMGLLSGGLMMGNGRAGLLNANQYAAGAGDRRQKAEMEALKMEYQKAQLAEMLAQADAHKQGAIAKQTAQANRQSLLYGDPSGVSSGAFSTPADGVGPVLPQGAAPMKGGILAYGRERGIPEQQILADMEFNGGKDIAKMMDPSFGKPKVARTIEIMRNGKPTTIQVGEDGQEIGAGYEQWKAPVFHNLGGRTAAIDPVSLGERGSFAQTQSPDSLASNALTRRGQEITLRGQNMTDARSREGNAAGKIPAGYRMKMDGTMEAIPGGPADIKSGEAGAKREAMQQGAVAQADRIIGKVDQALSKVGVTSAGLGGSMLASVPGSKARNLQADLDTIKANLGFAELQAMRAASPTGGALGAIAVQELTALQSTIASLDQAQGADQLKARLGEVKKHYGNWKQAVSGASTPSTGGATGGWGIKKVN